MVSSTRRGSILSWRNDCARNDWRFNFQRGQTLRYARGALCLIVALVAWQAKSAEWRPEKNVEIIVGAGAGGGIDATARLIQRIWQVTNMVPATSTVINKPGGGGAVGWVYLNQHAGDGHYLAVSPTNLVTNRITGSHVLNYADVTPLALLFHEYVAFAVRTDSPIRSGRDLLDRIKSEPQSVAVGLPSVGNVFHIALAKVTKIAGGDPRKLKVVVFKSVAESSTALLGKHIELVPTAPANVIAHARAGRMRIVALTAPRRFAGDLADVPTWREQGVDAVTTNWRAVVGPKGLSPPQLAYWDGIFGQLARHDDWKRELERELREASYLSAAETTKFLGAQNEEFRQVLSELGLAK